jgi:hypothetical protein
MNGKARVDRRQGLAERRLHRRPRYAFGFLNDAVRRPILNELSSTHFAPQGSTRDRPGNSLDPTEVNT